MWVFGYGSLIWRPDFPFERAVPGVVIGYARRFWHLSPDHRGTPTKPGRVVSLVPERTGHCFGVAYKVPEEAVESTIAYLDHREKAGYTRAEVMFHPDDGSAPFELSVYIALEEGNIYQTGPTDEDDIVETILAAHGKSGSNLEYALRLADCQRRLAPHISDPHLFGLERKLLRACERAHIEDEILRKLNYPLTYFKRNESVESMQSLSE